ncbi:MAG TPA: monovalent cation/H(+) antiporter subunit G [Myxococcaceae bacterium]|nr:monovalent cation/H(+) antiporter subunit G [Myxococcaceae bacterium]
MTPTALPFWGEVLIAIFVLTGATFSFIGALGLVRLKSFYARIHPPTLTTTIGVWALGIATALQSSLVEGRPVLKAMLVPILVAVTMPVTTIFLMRAALFRDRIAGKDVPPNLTHRSVRPVLPTSEGALDAGHREDAAHVRSITP